MTKKEIRNIYKQKRLALSNDKRIQLHEDLITKTKNLILPSAKIILSYHPIINMGEINIKYIELVIQSKIASIQFVYPQLVDNKGNMEAVIEPDDAQYQINKWHIIEAQHTQIIDPLKIDIAFVPLLAMDKKGYRVGYGKGYYDRFLNRCKKDIYLIGFSYFEPVDEITDTQTFDVPLHLGITPYHIYEF